MEDFLHPGKQRKATRVRSGERGGSHGVLLVGVRHGGTLGAGRAGALSGRPEVGLICVPGTWWGPGTTAQPARGPRPPIPGAGAGTAQPHTWLWCWEEALGPRGAARWVQFSSYFPPREIPSLKWKLLVHHRPRPAGLGPGPSDAAPHCPPLPPAEAPRGHPGFNRAPSSQRGARGGPGRVRSGSRLGTPHAPAAGRSALGVQCRAGHVP